MGRNPMKESRTPYKKARLKAAEWDGRLSSRETASEMLGVAEYTLGDYERGNVKRVPPDMVLRMADLYNAPWLISNYCMNECPICGFLPLSTDDGDIQDATLKILRVLQPDEIERMQKQLIEIAADGVVGENEAGTLFAISESLNGVAEAISELKIVCEKTGKM